MPPRKKSDVDETAVTITKFYAPWCGACTALEPELDRVRQKRPNLAVQSVNTDDEPNRASMHGVRVLPTLVFTHADGTNDVLEAPADADAVLSWLKRIG